MKFIDGASSIFWKLLDEPWYYINFKAGAVTLFWFTNRGQYMVEINLTH
ncbi:hypothetical protein [Fodinibius saliphilus]|nr:hypothetical protein [Fodinibius saliphilus]